MQALEIDIAAIHDVDRTRLGHEKVERVDVVQLAVRDVDEARDAAAQVQERVQLHGRLGGPEMRPREDRQAEIDGRRIERIDGVGELQAKLLAGIGLPRLRDQPVRQLGIDAPVAQLVGVGQGRSPDRLAEAMW